MTAFEATLVLTGAFLGGFVNAIAGGGGLVTLPVMLGVFPNTPLPTIFGTTKGGMVWGTAWAARSYAKRVSLPWRRLLPAVGLAAVGGFAGAWVLTQVPSEWLRKILPVVLTGVFFYTLKNRHFGHEHAPLQTPRYEMLWAGLIAIGLGFYDGFFGPGTGSFFVFLFVRVLGYDFLHASAAAKLLNATTNLAAITMFFLGGLIWWGLVIPLALVNVAGASLGTWLALHRGSGFVRRVFLVIVAGLILKTGYDAYLKPAQSESNAVQTELAAEPSAK